VQVGRVPLYLLDTNVPENAPHLREITSTLYGGDRETRIRQEIVLGVGGVRALRALGLKPTVYHMNEGHSAFLGLERLRMAMADHSCDLATAREFVSATNVFTTHTPVPAGNETFEPSLVQRYTQPLLSQIGLGFPEFLRLAQVGDGRPEGFGMTVLALRTAGFSNGVSRLHGEVSRKMWQGLWPSLPAAEIPIHAITNGIHTRTWVSHDMADLLVRYLGPRFMEKPWDFGVWDRVDRIPASELWRTHQIRKERLIFFVRKRLLGQLRHQGAGPSALRAAEEVLDPEALTIGFSRRFATYKRATLLLQQAQRLARLLSDEERPVQILFAGKAHPQDIPAKDLIKAVVHHARDPELRRRVVFLEDYDINIARYLVQGVDVWLNTPRRPLEASGTSGMKAAANGALNCSVLDGWWVEGCDVDTGWAIGNGDASKDDEEQDRIDAESLFHLLEGEIVPLFYDRDAHGMPRGWIDMMKASIRKLGAQFNTHRMVAEYAQRAYLPAHDMGRRWTGASLAGAGELAQWRGRVTQAWPGVSVRLDDVPAREVRVGEVVAMTIRGRLGGLQPGDVAVEVYHGPLDPGGHIRDGEVARATFAASEGDDHVFRVEVRCRVTGRYGFAARILPRHDDMINPLTPLLLNWE
jgi:starch phosphorylase